MNFTADAKTVESIKDLTARIKSQGPDQTIAQALAFLKYVLDAVENGSITLYLHDDVLKELRDAVPLVQLQTRRNPNGGHWGWGNPMWTRWLRRMWCSSNAPR